MTRPLSPPDPETQPWWDATRASKLLIQRCETCAHAQLYPRAVCTRCHGSDLGWMEASGRGVVYSHTTVHRAPDPAFEPPYVVALVRLEEGPVVMTNIVGASVACDQPVHLVWEDLADGRKLPLFERDDHGL